MLDTPIMSLLETSLDYSSTQQAAISSNLANINTPGYVRKDASFATVLDQASRGDNSGFPQVIMQTDGSGQMSPSLTGGSESADTGGVPVVADTSSAMRVDGNNVDVDTEMSKLAENQIYYQAVSQFMGGQLTSLKYVIGGG
jgi:flagellar basal-body rod protein FlgB